MSFQSGFVPGPTHLVSQTSQPNLEVGRPAQLVTQTSQTALEMDRPTQPVTQTSNDQERSNELEQMDTDVSNDQREMDTEDHGPDSPQVKQFPCLLRSRGRVIGVSVRIFVYLVCLFVDTKRSTLNNIGQRMCYT